MRTAKCCMEQGIHEHFGCDLSDFEAISDPGCPEKVNQVARIAKIDADQKDAL